MTDKELELIEKEYKEQLDKTGQAYMLAGAKAMCQTILDKANDKRVDYKTRIKEIQRFCKVALNLTNINTQGENEDDERTN